MLTLKQFMGGGEAKSPINPFTLGLGQGRMNNYRPSGVGQTVTLLDPNRDIFLRAGGPYYIVCNSSGTGTLDFINEIGGGAVGTLSPANVAVLSIVGSRPNREWQYIDRARKT
jgi:hypothetical protein